MNCSLKFTVNLPKDSSLSNLVCCHYFKHSISESHILKHFLLYFPSPISRCRVILSLPPPQAQFLAHRSFGGAGRTPAHVLGKSSSGMACEAAAPPQHPRPPDLPAFVPADPAAVTGGRNNSATAKSRKEEYSPPPAALAGIWVRNGENGTAPAALRPPRCLRDLPRTIFSLPLYAHGCA